MPRTADTLPFAEFVERIPVDDWRRMWAATKDAGRIGTELFINGETGGYTAVYNVNKGIESCIKGESYSLGTKDYNGDVVLQPGIKGSGATGRMDTLADAIRRFNDGERMNNQPANGGSTPTPAASTPVRTSSEPLPVDPVLIDAVTSMFTRTQSAIQSGPTADVQAFDTGRDFLGWMWNNTPESIRGARTADIVRGVLDGAESATHRGLVRTLIDDIRTTFNLGEVPEFYGKLFNLLPKSAVDGAKEQVAAIVGRTYLFNPDSDAFRMWHVQVQTRAAMMQQLAGNFSDTVDIDTLNRAAVLHAAQTLDGIVKGLKNADSRYKEYAARQTTVETPPPPPVEKVAHDALPAAVQENLPADIWNELDAAKQRQILVNRGVVETGDGLGGTTWRMKSDVENKESESTPPPADTPETDPLVTPPTEESTPQTQRRRR